jgi:hypothetical protein
MSLSLFLADINKYVDVQTADRPSNRVYRLVSRSGSDTFASKDLSSPLNTYKFSTYSKFTVSGASVKANYPTIQAAIDAASLTGNREVVLIAPGIYTEDITLNDNVSLEGCSPAFEVDAHLTVLSGNITCVPGTGSEITLARFSYRPSGTSLTISGTNPGRILMNGMHIRSLTTAAAIVCTNPNMSIFLNNCIVSGADVAADLAGEIAVFRACVLGDLIPMMTTPRVLLSTSVASVVYSNGHVKFVTSSSQLIIANSFFNGDQPLAELTSTTMIMMNSAYLASGSTTLVDGNGAYVDGGNALLGVSTVAPGIVVIPLPTSLNSSGSFTPTIGPVVGVSSPTTLFAKYGRIGSCVTVDVRFTYDGDVIAPVAALSIPLPLPSDFLDADSAVGTGAIVGSVSGEHRSAVISSDTGSQNVTIIGVSTGMSETCTFTGRFTYHLPSAF